MFSVLYIFFCYCSRLTFNNLLFFHRSVVRDSLLAARTLKWIRFFVLVFYAKQQYRAYVWGTRCLRKHECLVDRPGKKRKRRKKKETHAAQIRSWEFPRDDSSSARLLAKSSKWLPRRAIQSPFPRGALRRKRWRVRSAAGATKERQSSPHCHGCGRASGERGGRVGRAKRNNRITRLLRPRGVARGLWRKALLR